jgi:hypothetical protein
VADAHLDHPGEISWWRDYGPAPVLGPCPHTECEHWSLGTIAYGPDFEHYELVTCDVRDGCAGQCRAWTVEYPPAVSPPWFTPDRPKHAVKPFLHVPTTEEDRS